ncbi:DUF211 domain-containing protein [Candidatus Woesearchaeota archaeon]|nr:DUF211 domain-containing protein [Candidatus Woesearchaeota archaeon]
MKKTKLIKNKKEVSAIPKNNNEKIKLLVLDVLKPHNPNIVNFGIELKKANGIDNIDISVYAVDEKTETVKVVIEGSDLDFDIIRDKIEQAGCVVHSVDKIAIGKKLCSYQLHDLQHGMRHL